MVGQRLAVLELCAEWGAVFLFVVFFSSFLRCLWSPQYSIYFFPLFFLSPSFWKMEILKGPSNPKQKTYQLFREIYSIITKYGRIDI